MRWSESQTLWWEMKRATGRWWYVAMHTLGYGLGTSLLQFAISQAWSNIIDFGWGLAFINLAFGTIIGVARWAYNESHYREALGSRKNLSADPLQ